MANDFKYAAFISYSHVDRKWALWLQRSLERYQLPKWLRAATEPTHPFRPVFRDEEELAAAPELGERIDAALAASKALIVVCSPAARDSAWVNEEVRRFRELGGRPIYSLIVAKDPHDGRSCFPPALLDQGQEPLAADITGDVSRRDTFLKLAAGLLQVDYDNLRQRESRTKQRRLLGIAAASVVGMVLTAGLALLAVISRNEAQEEKQRAEREALTANQVVGFLIELLSASHPEQSRGKPVTVREVLDRGRDRIDGELVDVPLVQARLKSVLAQAYEGLAHYDQALPLYEGALDIYNNELGADALDTASVLGDLGTLQMRRGDQAAAERLVRQSLAIREQTLGKTDPASLRTLANLASVLYLSGRTNDALAMYREAYEGFRLVQGPAHAETLGAANNLANVLSRVGRNDEAIELYKQALQNLVELHGEDHPDALGIAQNLAVELIRAGRFEEAEKLARKTLVTRERVFGTHHPDTLLSLASVAELEMALGKTRTAAEGFARVWRDSAVALGARHQRTLAARVNYSAALIKDGRPQQALEQLRPTIDDLRKNLGASHPTTINATNRLALLFAQLERLPEALSAMHEVQSQWLAVAGASDRRTLNAQFNAACLAASSGATEAALDYLEAAVAGGFARPELLEDPDLLPLVSLPRFQTLKATVEQRRDSTGR